MIMEWLEKSKINKGHIIFLWKCDRNFDDIISLFARRGSFSSEYYFVV